MSKVRNFINTTILAFVLSASQTSLAFANESTEIPTTLTNEHSHSLVDNADRLGKDMAALHVQITQLCVKVAYNVSLQDGQPPEFENCFPKSDISKEAK